MLFQCQVCLFLVIFMVRSSQHYQETAITTLEQRRNKEEDKDCILPDLFIFI